MSTVGLVVSGWAQSIFSINLLSFLNMSPRGFALADVCTHPAPFVMADVDGWTPWAVEGADWWRHGCFNCQVVWRDCCVASETNPLGLGFWYHPWNLVCLPELFQSWRWMAMFAVNKYFPKQFPAKVSSQFLMQR